MIHKISSFLSLFCFVFLFSCSADDVTWKGEIALIKQELLNQKKLIESLQQSTSISSVVQDKDKYTIVFSNGQTITLTNGLTPLITIGDNGNWFVNGEDTGHSSKGKDGVDGKDGANGIDGVNGTNGSDGNDGVDGINGIDGIDGIDGINGIDGKDVVDGKDAPYITRIVQTDNTLYFYFSDDTILSCKITRDTIYEYNKDKLDAIKASVAFNKYATNNSDAFVQFLVFTDIHSYYKRLDRLFEYSEQIPTINSLINLGDLLENSNNMNYNWEQRVLSSSKPVLSVVGNHEVLSRKDIQVKGMTDAEIMEYFYSENQKEHNGEVHPDNKPYWYKDYSKTSNNVTKKLRVIGLYQFEYNPDNDEDGYPIYGQVSGKGKDLCYYSQQQIDWLVDLLDKTEDDTYVLILSHCPITRNMVKEESVFSPMFIEYSSSVALFNTNQPDLIPMIVDAWENGKAIDIGVKMSQDQTEIKVQHTFSAHAKRFVSYLCGHTHYDMITHCANYPSQKQIILNCATSAVGQQASDIIRQNEGKTQDCATIFVYDWEYNVIRLIRVGADLTTEFTDRKYGLVY